MDPERQIVRWVAAMILAIVAYALPSAARAHDGHGHHGRNGTAAIAVRTDAPTIPAPMAQATARPGLAVVLPAADGEPTAALRPTETGRCCDGCRCGTTAGCTCATGILAGHAVLPLLPPATVLPVPHDVEGRPALGPAALPEPPRTRA